MVTKPHSGWLIRRIVALSAVFVLMPDAARRVSAADHVWIEAESLGQPPEGFKAAAWGNKHYLSGESWLVASIEGPAAAKLPADGVRLRYPFEVTAGGRHEVWARVGYEFVRSPFRWRIDDGRWGDDGPDRLTSDLMSLQDWNEVAWTKLGAAELTAGKHILEIHFERRVLPGKKEPERILAGLDCFCLSKGPFLPNGRHQPGNSWQTDEDRSAAGQVFRLPASRQPRATLPLAGDWQIARWDEQEIVDRDQPVKELPAEYRDFPWKAVRVPGNRDKVRPDLLYCHRFLYRTRVFVPAEMKGRSFVLRFPSTALLASAFVNGTRVGGSDTPCVAWEADATAAVRPGDENEVVVAIKDCYYALAKADDAGKSPRYMFNFPVGWFYSNGGGGATRFADFPVLLQVQGAGILETPSLIAAGPVYVADVFAKPSVARKELGLEITLRNSTAAPVQVRLSNDVIPVGGAGAEKRFATKELTIPANGEQLVELTEKWENPRLWWPDEPQQQEVFTRVSLDDHDIDLKKTKFGFREWGWQGQSFTLNGVPWHFRADLLHNGKLQDKDRAAVVADWRKSGINTVRYWGQEPWVGASQEETLDFFDSVGMPVRRSGIFDGEAGSYALVESKDGKTVPRKALFDNWIRQLRAWVKAERNHPSVFVWSIENEITYINARNWGLLDPCEPEIRRAAQAVMAIDPTRPAMIDGGDALRDRSLPIYGNHYNEAHFREYPDEAYTMKLAFARHRGNNWTPWPIGDDRPLFLGESYFAAGNPPAAYAAVMGEAAFLGRSAAEPGVRKFARMLAEGYRWHGIAGFHFWMAGDGPDNEHYKAFQPICALCREWNWTFRSGEKVKRIIRVFNDTRTPANLELAWSLAAPGKWSQGKSVRWGAADGAGGPAVAPGNFVQSEIEIDLADQRLADKRLTERTPATFTMRVLKDGKPVFADERPCFILPADGPPNLRLPTGDLLVLDPGSVVKQRLRQRGIAFQEVASFDALPAKVRVLIVGPDALTPRQATDPKWLALAAGGGRIIVLDQENPLHYQALPADLEPTPHTGRIAFPENAEHPAFAGLAAPDFCCWSGDHVVYRRAYRKASRGARSLLQCDDELSCTALAECPVRDGILLLAQLDFSAKLATDPVAQRLFENLVTYAASYQPVAKATVTVFADGDLRLKLLDATGVKHTRATDLVRVIGDAKTQVVIADASPGNLAKLAAAGDAMKEFTARGGQLMLWGLTPEGLADFNKVVGFNHVIRPFRMERVTLPAVRDPLLAGLTNRDVALEGTERIYPWSGDRYPAADTFTHVIDLDDIAPFATSQQYAHGWSQMTNGLTSADSWKFIFYHNLKEAGSSPKWSAELPKEEEVTDISIIINAHYHKITKLRLTFDDARDSAVTLDLKPVAELRQDFALKPRRCRRLTLEPLAWTPDATAPVIGIDNLWVKVRRGEGYTGKVAPLLNLGALVRYKLGHGGVILNQVRVQASEPNPLNAEKKQNLIATLLRNLGSPFVAERTLVAGLNLKYTPIPLGEKCTQYLTADRGWIQGVPDLAHLPVGEQKLAGVTYVIRDFKTSPLPSCIMLAGPAAKGSLPRAVDGIPVGHRADALFFLHTLHQTREHKPQGDAAKLPPPAAFKYVVRYADGRTQEVPVRLGRGVGHWIVERPAGLPEAAVAWAAPFPKEPGRQAVVYQMSWTNPRPQAEIESIGIRYDQASGEYGVPVLLAVTAATAD